jgi:predicted methyltransferase
MAARSKIENPLSLGGLEPSKRLLTSQGTGSAGTGTRGSPSETCRHCGGRTIDREARRGILDNLMVIARLRPYRCRRCYLRFYGRAS